MSKNQAAEYESSNAFKKQLDNIQFSQEKYSNGETSMAFFEENLQPGNLYVLDEPETSLSPANQIRIAEQINELARYFDNQFIIATHSPSYWEHCMLRSTIWMPAPCRLRSGMNWRMYNLSINFSSSISICLNEADKRQEAQELTSLKFKVIIDTHSP